MIDTALLDTLNGCAALVTKAIEEERVTFTAHALMRMEERGIGIDDIAFAIREGHQEQTEGRGRIIYTASFGGVVVAVDGVGAVFIVTVFSPRLKLVHQWSANPNRKSRSGFRTNTYLQAEEKANPIELY